MHNLQHESDHDNRYFAYQYMFSQAEVEIEHHMKCRFLEMVMINIVPKDATHKQNCIMFQYLARVIMQYFFQFISASISFHKLQRRASRSTLLHNLTEFFYSNNTGTLATVMEYLIFDSSNSV